MTDILDALRTTPVIKLPGDRLGLEAGKVVRQMMIKRAQAADEIERLRSLADSLGNDAENMAKEIMHLRRIIDDCKAML